MTIFDIPELINTIEETTSESFREYESLHTKFSELVSILPLPIIPFPTPIIYRCRENMISEMFFHRSQIDRPPSEFIFQIGRANLPHQSIFYGAIPSEKISTEFRIRDYESTILETNKELIQSSTGYSHKRFTIGEWIVKEKFNCIFLSSSNSSIEKNRSVNNSNEIHVKTLRQKFDTEEVEKVLVFWKYISEKFSKKNPANTDYMITTAFYNAAINFYKNSNVVIGGIIYSSAQTESETLNAAIIPEFSDLFLKLNRGALMECILDKKERWIFQCKVGLVSSDGAFNFDKDNF